MRRDRDGSVIDADDDQHRCDSGWVGENADGARIPCLVCRPHLMPTQTGYAVRPDTRLSERQWQQRVTDLATLRGWRWYHPHYSQRSTPGWPDLALVRRGRFVVAELKTATGRVRPEQQQWLDDLRACPGVEAYLWRFPTDWLAAQQVLM